MFASIVYTEGPNEYNHHVDHLPDDVLSIIREYSKPVLKHFREYNRILKLNHLDEWTTLKERLMLSDKERLTDKERLADHILPLLLAYETATKDWHLAMSQENKLWESGYMGFNMTVLRAERNRRKFVTTSKKFTMQKRLRALTRELYGIEKESYEMRDPSKLGVWV
jgi:hypothetical protein